MDPRYDLFELPPDGFPRWISSAADLKEARKQLESLPDPQVGGEYLVRDPWSGSVVAYRAHLPAGMVVRPVEPERRARAATCVARVGGAAGTEGSRSPMPRFASPSGRGFPRAYLCPYVDCPCFLRAFRCGPSNTSTGSTLDDSHRKLIKVAARPNSP